MAMTNPTKQLIIGGSLVLAMYALILLLRL